MSTKRSLTGYTVRADTAGEVDFLASSPEKARDSLIIEADAWQLEAFRRNPILAWSHDYSRPPIGRVTKIEATPRGLLASARFDLADPFAADIARKYKEGYLSSFSVGFSILEQQGDRVRRAELLEVSSVPVPSDTLAIASAVRAYRSLSAHRSGVDLVAFRDALRDADGETAVLATWWALVEQDIDQQVRGIEPRVKECVRRELATWLLHQ